MYACQEVGVCHDECGSFSISGSCSSTTLITFLFFGALPAPDNFDHAELKFDSPRDCSCCDMW